MSATAAAFPAPPTRKARIKKMILTVILISVGIHVLGGIVAGFWIVAKYFSNPPAEFKVVKDIRIPARQREHSMNMAALDSLAPKPSFNDKMQSLRPTAFALPELPKVPMDQMLPLDPSAIVSDAVSSLVGAGGLGGGGGGGLGGMGGTGTGFSFFGIQSNAKRILLLFDVSGSVVNKANKAGIPLSKIKEETLNTINGLTPNSRFGMIQFTQNYKPFQAELVPATDRNKQAAKTWVEQEWVESGSMGAGGKVVSNARGFLGVLEWAAQARPDVIFVISDASFQWKPGGQIANIPWKELQDFATGSLQGAEGCPIHFIGFEMKPGDRREAGILARRTQGKVRELK
ncbi:MAG TPA: hypothetical protein VIS74_05970 [Chthoniobacterales bacterium]